MTSLQADLPAKTSASLVPEVELRESDRPSGLKCSELLAKQNQSSWSGKTSRVPSGGLTEVLQGLSRLGYGFDVEILSAAEVRILGKESGASQFCSE